MTEFSSFVQETGEGWNVTLTISDTNDGDVPLTGAHVHLLADGVEYAFSPMGVDSPYFVGGDDGNEVMDPGETWTWQVTVSITSTTYFETWGHGTDPLGNPVDYPDFASEYADITVEVGNATRTQGFWGTHLDFTTYVFENYLGSNIYLGFPSENITNMNDLMGVFWANNARNSDRSRRDALCQAKIIAANQALAAVLNSAMPGGAPLPAGYSLAEIQSILSGSDIEAIQMLNNDLTAFNESGDNFALDPSLPPTGPADPREAKNIANIPFADCP